MKTTILKLKYLLILILFAGIVACEGEKGEMGPPGVDGIDGINGVDGKDGVDGQDGNANVTTISISSSSITWFPGTYLGRPANVYVKDEPLVNQDIVDHGTVLGYCYLDPFWYSMPFIWQNSTGTSLQHVLHGYETDTIAIYAYQTSGVLDPSFITEYRFMLITDNTVTKSTSAKYDIIYKLGKAGVNVNNYYEVMDYYSLEY